MEIKKAAVILAALAQESRLAVFRLLVAAGPAGLSASAIAEGVAIPPATLSFHLKALAHAGLVSARPNGRFVIYSANFKTMNRLLEFLLNDCCAGAPGLCFPASGKGALKGRARASAASGSLRRKHEAR